MNSSLTNEKTIVQWSKDPILIDALEQSDKNGEISTDYMMVNHLVSCGSIQLERIESDLMKTISDVRLRSGKSAELTSKLVYFADLAWAQENYLRALERFNLAIRYQPLNVESDYERLAIIYLRRMRVTIAMDNRLISNHYSAVRDIELASMASIDTVQSYLKDYDIKMQNQVYRTRDGRPLIDTETISGPSLPRTQIHSNVDISVSSENGQIHLCAEQAIPDGTSVFIEDPFMELIEPSLDKCPNCKQQIIDQRFWPCQFCVEIVFCSRQCEQLYFPKHKYECGIVGYLQSFPLYATILNFYIHSDSTPLTRCPLQTSFIHNYLDSIGSETFVKQSFLNLFRQCMDRHEQRNMLRNDRRQYFQNLLRSIDLFFLFDHIQSKSIEFDSKRITNYSIDSEQSEKVTTNWMGERSKIEVIPCVFRDLKRFIILESNFDQYHQKQKKQLFMFSQIILPSLNSREPEQKKYKSSNVANLECRWIDDRLHLVTNCDISVGQQLSTIVV
ncbi:hypothetical protein BLOT_011937 [Blomia tropicalis]|nr:hypothetical protein BLOT_011937 [Blomia tropicalis]